MHSVKKKGKIREIPRKKISEKMAAHKKSF